MAKNNKRKIITDRKMASKNERHSDAEIDRLGRKTDILIKASKYGTIAVMIIVAVYIIFSIPGIVEESQSGYLEVIVLGIVTVAICGIGVNGILYSLMAKRAEGSFWTAYRQEILVNMPEEESDFIALTIFKEEPGLEYEQMTASVLVDVKYDQLCYTHDTLYGEYGENKETCFRFTDLKAGVPRRGEKGRMESKTVFDGVLGMVWNDDMAPLRKNGFIQILTKDYKPEAAGYTLDHIMKTGDEAFDAVFNVHVEKPNRIQGFFTDEIRGYLMEMREAVGCPIAVSFNGGWMFVAVNDSPKYFEAEMDKRSAEKREQMRGFIRLIDRAGYLFIAAEESTPV